MRSGVIIRGKKWPLLVEVVLNNCLNFLKPQYEMLPDFQSDTILPVENILNIIEKKLLSHKILPVRKHLGGCPTF